MHSQRRDDFVLGHPGGDPRLPDSVPDHDVGVDPFWQFVDKSQR
jgi:hypothetical protein